MIECSFANKVVVGYNPVAVTSTSDMVPASSKEFLDIQTHRSSTFKTSIKKNEKS